MIVGKHFLTVHQWCEVTQMGRTNTYRFLRSGKIRAVKIGKRYLIPSAELQSFVEREDARA
jgi:excisionase family DNA binding protein